MKQFRTFSRDETIELGYRLGKFLKRGDIVCLTGSIGTGKTVFVSGIAKALGISCHITSPTFTIVNEYASQVPLYHFDVYRIADADEMFEIGFDEYIDGNGIIVIEWADLIKNILPHESIRIDIEKDASGNQDTRIISIRVIGDRYRGYEKLFDH